jgi:hypothetical protein
LLQEACERLLAEAEQRRNEAITAAEEEYQRMVEAVALIQAELTRRSGPERRLSHGKLSSVVLNAIDELDEPFTVRDVEARLQDLAPEVAERVSIASLSTTLRRLVGRRLDLAEPGSATRPSKYRKAS